jgi:hypothetical protein
MTNTPDYNNGHKMTEYTPEIDIITATRQQMFDFMLNHLRNQGGPSVDKDIGDLACMYRGDNGRMCAIGCMIPDRLYNPRLEGLTANEYLRCAGGSIDNETRDFLDDAQNNLHDDLLEEHFLTSLEENAIDLAEEYQLTYTPPVTEGNDK